MAWLTIIRVTAEAATIETPATESAAILDRRANSTPDFQSVIHSDPDFPCGLLIFPVVVLEEARDVALAVNHAPRLDTVIALAAKEDV